MPKIDEFIAPRRAIADPRTVGMRALDLAKRVVKIEPPRLGLHLLDQVHSGLRVPMRAGHRMISPRSSVEITVWVKWFNPE